MAKTFLLALDAGHYKNTAGKRVPAALDPAQTREWYLNDRVCDYLAERAAQYEGFEIMRVDDPTGNSPVELLERCNKANAANADFYLSVHHNANNGEPWNGGGVVAFCSVGSAVSPAWRDGLYDAVIAAGGLKGDRTAPKTKKNYYVLIHTDMPAVLMELGFMDSRSDWPVIKTDEYAKAVGYAMADYLAKKAELKKRVELFSDVPADAWYAGKLSRAVALGIVEGVGDNKFEPDRPATRAEIAVMMVRLYDALKKS